METLKCSQKESQKYLDKKRLKQNNLPIHKSQTIQGKVELTHFKPESMYLEPIFITPIFAIYDKPAKLLVHPKGYSKDFSLCDDIKSRFGKEANPVHRLDYETSGLIMISIKKSYEASLKMLFAKKQIQKIYLALVEGNIKKPQKINLPIRNPNKSDKYKDLGIRSLISPEGKISITQIVPIHYNKYTDTTLLKIIPITGRTHQIRIHLSAIGHKIIGESLYGVNEKTARDYLENKSLIIDKTSILRLHAQRLSFVYNNIHYDIKSHQNFKEDL
ncbi:RluA family pseudouridine synthase [Helicobacter sp. 13S00477-4]|uniref:RluA family pseudouridine synthase n=1 Tax=Helicobacter sp. 13S00477-4 TaxID=1905759 RepID=UPI0015D9ACD8|nr:RluA family pseudouridine synthase [Helicobacter sp. 13S00477-4]